MPQPLTKFTVAGIELKLPLIEIIDDQLLIEKGIQLKMLRLDQVDSTISGNKIFKLHYYLENALKNNIKSIVTFGGAYSNHLAATAYACKKSGLNSIGIVRGERPQCPSPTLQFCAQQGMELIYTARKLYQNISQKNSFDLPELDTKKDFITIPEGGYGIEGSRGAGGIPAFFDQNIYSHVCLAVGTGSTLSGIANNLTTAKILGFPALKGLKDIEERMLFLGTKKTNWQIIPDYHFGGYAKYDASLISFMSTFYHHHQIPLDFVYTGKMMYGVYDLIHKGFFEKGAQILCIHTGGLQGNQSFPKGTLPY
ncbi:MAG: pyridoxal-phosphate dependent enzyme [Bacteroidetes bacterium]|nr:pyridoxal-phosphate dependent enzyme [Bacteroidota bacterium]